MGWSRAYNLTKTDTRKIYQAGATGIQIDWRVTDDGDAIGTVTTWRN
jgi:hypothetical protein